MHPAFAAHLHTAQVGRYLLPVVTHHTNGSFDLFAGYL
jgi:hypothetical protein